MADIAELIVALKLRDGVSSGLGRLNGQLRGMQGGLSQVSRGIGQVGQGLDRGITRGALAAGGALAFVVHSAVEFEDAFTGVAKTVDASAVELAGLSDEIRAMSREMPIAATELAGIAEQAGALGVAVEDIEEFTRTAALIGVTTDISSDQAATALGQLSNVLSLTGQDYEAFASTLVDLGNKGASTESQILEIATRVGAAGDLIGLSADQVLAFSSAAANLGIEAEAGGSAIQKFFIDTLTNIQDEDLLGVMARTAGQTGQAFKQAFEKDAAGALDVFLRGLGKLDEAAQIETLQTLGFNDVRITRLLLGFANNTDNLTDSLNIAHDAFRANVALQTEAERKFANTASQIKILRNNLTDAAVTVGNELLPVITELSQEFVGFLNQPGTQAGLREFATGLAEGVRDLAAELRGTDFSGIISGLQLSAQIAKTAFDAFRALPEPLQQLAVAAFAVNKISGGAIGSIAAGLGNILLGSLKTITAGNVTVIGGNVTGAGGAAGAAGGGGFAATFGAAFAAALGVGAGAAIAGPIYEATVKPAKDFFQGKINEIAASSDPERIRNAVAELDEELAMWAKKPPQLRSIMEGLLAELQEKRDALAALIMPKNLGGLDKGGSPILRLAEAINTLRTGAVDPKIRTDKTGNFVPTVKLDTSSVTDLRDPVKAAIWELQHDVIGADRVLIQKVQDHINATRQAERIAEAALSADRIIMRYQGEGLAVLRDQANTARAALSSDQAMLQTARVQSGQLGTATGLLAGINSKNFSPTVNVSSNVSVSVNASVIEQRLVTERLIRSGVESLTVPTIR